MQQMSSGNGKWQQAGLFYYVGRQPFKYFRELAQTLAAEQALRPIVLVALEFPSLPIVI